MTCEGQVLGTPRYMSPEQARGDARQVDGRSDIYGLGVVMYQLLTGRVPFADADGMSAHLYHIVHTDPPAPRTLEPAVPRDLETICRKALAKDLADRFATAAEFAEELGRWLRDESLRIRPPTAWERLRRWGRRNRLVTAVGAVAAVLLALTATVLGTLAWSANERDRLRAVLLAEVEEKKAEYEIRTLLEKARQRLRRPTGGRRLETQKLILQIATPLRRLSQGHVRDELHLEGRSLYVESFSVPDMRVVDKVRFPPGGLRAWSAALHPDGNRMAIGTKELPVLWERGNALTVPPAAASFMGMLSRLAFSPKGELLVFAPTTGGLEVWNERVSRMLKRLEPRGTNRHILSLGFSADGKVLWACHADGDVCSWSLPDYAAGPAWRTKQKPAKLVAAQFNSDSSLLAVADDSMAVAVYRRDGTAVAELPAGGSDVEALAWSPDNRQVAVGGRDGQLKLWKLTSERPVWQQTLHASSVGVSAIVFSPNGRWLLAGHVGRGFQVWETETGQPIAAGFGGAPWGVTHDGRTCATTSADGAAFIEIISPAGMQCLAGDGASVHKFAWAADGRHLASVDSSFEVRTWDVDRSAVVDVFQAPRSDFFAVNASLALSGDARYLAYATGGRHAARVLVRDVVAGRTLNQWPLPGAFEHLCNADGRFLLVREEKEEGLAIADSDPWPVQSVVYEVFPDRPPLKLRVLRRSEKGDTHRYMTGRITSDGRYYVWLGPRRPLAAQRVEVYEVRTGRQVLRFPDQAEEDRKEMMSVLDQSNRYFYLCTSRREWFQCYLPGGGVERVADASVPLARLLGDDLSVYRDAHATLHSGLRGPAWLILPGDADNQFHQVAFSPGGRHLAWVYADGSLWLADVAVLRDKARDFERLLQCK